MFNEMKASTSSQKHVCLTLLFLILLASTFSASAQNTTTTMSSSTSSTSIPQPQTPDPNYTWSASNDTLPFTFGGQTYPDPISFGSFLPPKIALNQKYPLYFYVRRTVETLPYYFQMKPFVASLCFGVTVEVTLTGVNVGLHVGGGWLSTYDRYVRHIEITGVPYSFPMDYSVSASYPQIKYSSFAGVPFTMWDGPYVAYVTVATGYALPEQAVSIVPITLIAALVVTLILMRGKKSRIQS